MTQPRRVGRQWIITKDQFLTQTEVNHLYSTLETQRSVALSRGVKSPVIRDYFILRVLLETGLRVSEAVALKVCDLRSGCLTVRSGKGGKPRSILLTEATESLIQDYIDIKARVLGEPVGAEDFLILSERRHPFTTRGVRKRVKLWFKACGLPPHLSCHSARHTYISFLIAAGVDLSTVKHNAGHSSLAVTSIYSHVVRNGLGSLDIYSSAFVGKRNSPVDRGLIPITNGDVLHPEQPVPYGGHNVPYQERTRSLKGIGRE